MSFCAHLFVTCCFSIHFSRTLLVPHLSIHDHLYSLSTALFNRTFSDNRNVLSNTIATSQMWLLSMWNVTSVTEKWSSTFYFILINLDLKSHMWLPIEQHRASKGCLLWAPATLCLRAFILVKVALPPTLEVRWVKGPPPQQPLFQLTNQWGSSHLRWDNWDGFTWSQSSSVGQSSSCSHWY